jgi:diketogulonate reductase-like aldo/keto reductase
MHWPVAGNTGAAVQPPLAATWAAMEALVGAGLCRAIGVANFSARKLDALLDDPSRTRPVSVLQAEAHPYWRNDALVAHCAARGVHFTAYSALGSRGSAGTPGGHAAGGAELMDSPLVHEVARAGAKKSVPQVLLRWALQARPACSVLFKSEQRAHIEEDAALRGWRLCNADAGALSAAPLQRRFCPGDIFLSPQGPYKTMRDLWDEEEPAGGA